MTSVAQGGATPSQGVVTLRSPAALATLFAKGSTTKDVTDPDMSLTVGDADDHSKDKNNEDAKSTSKDGEDYKVDNDINDAIMEDYGKDDDDKDNNNKEDDNSNDNNDEDNNNNDKDNNNNNSDNDKNKKGIQNHGVIDALLNAWNERLQDTYGNRVNRIFF